VASGGEEFGNAGGVEACLCQSKRGAKASTTSAAICGEFENQENAPTDSHDDGIVFVLNQRVLARSP